MATINGTNNGDNLNGTNLADRVFWRRGAVQTIKRKSPSQRSTPMKAGLLTAASIVLIIRDTQPASG